MSEINREVLGTAGEPCGVCGTPLAVDQRYCLECGTRRGDARLNYRELLPEASAPVAVAPRRDWRSPSSWAWSANTALIAGVGCLLLALGIGVLIGNSGNDKAPTAAAAPAQVIKVSGGGAATPTDAAASTDDSASTSTSKKKKHKKSKDDTTADVDTASSAAASKATNPALKQLSKSTGKDYSKTSAKLPKQVGTGGKAPPIDKSKPAGGGSSSESIG